VLGIRSNIVNSIIVGSLLIWCRPVLANECSDFEQESVSTPTVLFDIAEVCANQGNSAKAVLMMIYGQMRSIVDLAMFPTKSEDDKKIASKLYGRLYYQMGGSGPDGPIVDAEKFIQLIESISSWQPANLLNYEPDWEYESAPSHERYILDVEKTKMFRINQLLRFRQHLQDSSDQTSETPEEEVDA
jgi:hypothetical protein